MNIKNIAKDIPQVHSAITHSCRVVLQT